MTSEHSKLIWTDDERSQLEQRIEALKGDQIAGLIYCVGIKFRKEDMEEVIKDIKTQGHGSGHLGIVIDEARSKDDLLWWVNFFESYR